MKKGVVYLFVLCLFLPVVAHSDNQISSTEAYLQELQLQGKERVVVTFKDAVDPSLVDKYGGILIRVFSTIKALVCEIPQENIDLLKQEESVKDVAPDVVMEFPEGGRERDPDELALFNRFKKEYLASIRKEYHDAIRQARREYLDSLRGLLSKRRTILLYNNLLRTYRRIGRTNSSVYRSLLSKHNELLREYYAEFRRILSEYRSKLTAAKENHVQLASEWRVKVDEMVALSYTGTVTVRWNNLEAGLNSKAAWDNYNLDGTGIKIAIIDTGINYTLENLNDHYLGGYDFVYDDDDPMPNMPTPKIREDHGTEVASLAVGEGAIKVVGVAYNASYYSLRMTDDDAGHPLATDVMAAIEWATDSAHKADIISMSLGTYSLGGLQQAFETICNNAYNAGILLVAASGNDGVSDCWYPAAFENVISVGAHTIDQTVATFSNGSVDIVAPGGDGDIITPEDNLYTVGADNRAWWAWGTSFATPHVSALLALQLQYARRTGSPEPIDFNEGKPFEVNNGYLWEVMKHSAQQLTSEPYDPVYQGKGKIWAAETDPLPPTPKDGSIDCMAEKWPLNPEVEYLNYLYREEGLYPAYYIGTSMYYDVNLTNNTNTAGNYASDIENINLTATQAYYQHEGEINTPGAPIEVFPAVSSLTAGSQEILSDTYYLPWALVPGLNRTILDLEFELTDDTNNRLIKVTYPYANIWCPPPLINEGFPIE